MLRMIHPARPQLHHEHGVEDVIMPPAPSLLPATASFAPMPTIPLVTDQLMLAAQDARSARLDGSLHQIERPAKRTSNGRTSASGPGHHRSLTRSRSSLEPIAAQYRAGSENAAGVKANEKPFAFGALSAAIVPPSSGGTVLGDVTNTARMQFEGQLPSAAPHTSRGPGEYKEQHHAASFLPAKVRRSSLGDVQHDTGLSAEMLMEPPTSSAPSNAPGGESAELGNAEDPQNVVEYAPDIYRVLEREEGLLQPSPNYMQQQEHVNWKMRAILVDWLVDVHKKYKLRPETLFLAIGLVDRYLELKATARRYLQLVGVTALLLAAKFEELQPPQINDFVYVTDKAYTPNEVIKMEVSMLNALDFKICRPTAAHFLERYQIVNGSAEAHRHLAAYLLELTLVDHKTIRHPPSRLAAAAILLSNKLMRRQPAWTPAAVKHTRMTEPMLKECAKEMCTLLEFAEHSPLQAVRKKYSQTKYHSVARSNFVGLFRNSNSSSTEEAHARTRRSSVAKSVPTPRNTTQ